MRPDAAHRPTSQLRVWKRKKFGDAYMKIPATLRPLGFGHEPSTDGSSSRTYRCNNSPATSAGMEQPH